MILAHRENQRAQQEKEKLHGERATLLGKIEIYESQGMNVYTYVYMCVDTYISTRLCT
jgi:hypothetical protein